MSEADALLKIAEAIEHLAAAVWGLLTVAWLTLLFKSQSSDDGARRIASSITSLVKLLHDKWHMAP